MVDVFAPAKVNLFLHVTGKHEGYHTLQTVCFFPSIGDRLTVTKRLPLAKEDELKITGPFAAKLQDDPSQNLILKLLQTIRENREAHKIPYYSIHLQKQLPIAAGLGGGSADAAAVMRVISRDTNIDFTAEPWRSEISSLGSDIAACYLSSPLLGEGIGDEILPWQNMPNFGVLIVNCGIEISTKTVYERNLQFSSPALMVQPKSQAGWTALIKSTRNDLQPMASSLVPEVGASISLLEDTDKLITARMSGSGASCFALYPSLVDAQVAEAKLKAEAPANWWIESGRATHGAEA